MDPNSILGTDQPVGIPPSLAALQESLPMATMLPAGIIASPAKDSRWLTLEVCREFTRDKCPRSEADCKYVHPPPHIEVQNGRVTCVKHPR